MMRASCVRFSRAHVDGIFAVEVKLIVGAINSVKIGTALSRSTTWASCGGMLVVVFRRTGMRVL